MTSSPDLIYCFKERPDNLFWCIVKFTHDNSISLIPRTWWVNDDCQTVGVTSIVHCPYSKNSFVIGVKDKLLPHSDKRSWRAYSAVLKLPAVIPDYDLGLFYEEKFGDEFEETDAEEEGYANEIVKKLSNHTDHTSYDSMFFLPNTPTHQMMHYTPRAKNARPQQQTAEVEVVHQSSCTNGDAFPNVLTNLSSKDIDNIPEKNVKKAILESEGRIKTHIDDLIQQKFHAMEAFFVTQLNKIVSSTPSNVREPCQHLDVEDKMSSLYSFPISTYEELARMDIELSDSSFKQYMVIIYNNL